MLTTPRVSCPGCGCHPLLFPDRSLFVRGAYSRSWIGQGKELHARLRCTDYKLGHVNDQFECIDFKEMDDCLCFMKMYIPISIFMAWDSKPQMPVRFGCLVVTSTPRHLQMQVVWFFYVSISLYPPAPVECAPTCSGEPPPSASCTMGLPLPTPVPLLCQGAQASDLNYFSGRSFLEETMSQVF